MTHGTIIQKGERYYTHLKKLFESIGNAQLNYKWLITYAECYPSDEETARLFENEYVILSGHELTEIIENEDFQWIWGVFSAFDPSVSDYDILKYKLPDSEHRGYWENPLALQHPLAEMEIAAFDSSYTLILTRDTALPDSFKTFYPDAEDLSILNESRANKTKTPKDNGALHGIFKSSLKKFLFSLFFILVGTCIAVTFSLWGIDELESERLASAIFSFAFAFIGLLYGLSSIFVYRFNKNAFLKIENGKIEAQFGFGQALSLDIKDITHVQLREKQINLYTNDRVFNIYGLENAIVIYKHITELIPFDGFSVDEVTRNRLRKSKKSYVIYTSVTAACTIMMFLHLLWCVLLTDGKDITLFSQSDTAVFCIFGFAELITIALTMYFADKCGKKRDLYLRTKHILEMASYLEAGKEGLESYENIITVKYFSDQPCRIVVYHPYEDVFAYMLERYNAKIGRWADCYENSIGFESLSDLVKDVEWRFGESFIKI